MASRNRKWLIILVMATGAGLLLLYWSGGQSKTVFKDIPDEPSNQDYRAQVLWPQTGEQAVPGQGSGVAVDSLGNVFYLQRAGYPYGNHTLIPEPTIYQLDSDTGKVVAAWGEDQFVSPHGLTIDDQDRVWVTDIMTNKIYVFSHEGKLLITYGDDYPLYLEAALRIKNVLPRFPAPMSGTTFARPTDIVVDKQGDFFVSDGYRNKRIAKFDSNGKLVWQVNRTGPRDGAFNLPHGIALDAEGKLYVADRDNARIQVFTPDGKWVATWSDPEIGRPYGVEVGPDQQLYVADGGDLLNGKSEHPQSHLVRMSLDGTVTARWSTWGSEEGQLKIPHDLAVDRQGNVYVAELQNNRLQKFIPDFSAR